MSHVVVITADPAAGLPDAGIAEVRDQLAGAGPVRRLSDCAAEIPVGAPQTARLPGADVNCLALADRRKKLLIADMDSTIISVECIDEVADFAGVREQVVPQVGL